MTDRLTDEQIARLQDATRTTLAEWTAYLQREPQRAVSAGSSGCPSSSARSSGSSNHPAPSGHR